MRIFAFHLLNDYSGSPKVLMQLLKAWVRHDIPATVVTCSGRTGFLSDIPGVQYSYYWYRWAANPLLRLINLTISQLLLFFSLLFTVKKDDILYINTVLPFGAALLGKVRGCRVIYHIHETTIKPPILKRFLFAWVRWAAHDIVYVSDYLRTQEEIPGKNVHILYNAIENEFLEKAITRRSDKTAAYHVLMVCSLKAYKGVNEFVALAGLHPEKMFRLVVNAGQAEIDQYFKTTVLPRNLQLYPTQTDLHPFYAWADVVLNLSRPDGWVETFGLTVIEGMAYGLPAIVPPVGGITELIEEGINGFQADSRQLDQLSEKLSRLGVDRILYASMRNKALHNIQRYSEDVFEQCSLHILRGFSDGKKLHQMENILKKPFDVSSKGIKTGLA